MPLPLSHTPVYTLSTSSMQFNNQKYVFWDTKSNLLYIRFILELMPIAGGTGCYLALRHFLFRSSKWFLLFLGKSFRQWKKLDTLEIQHNKISIDLFTENYTKLLYCAILAFWMGSTLQKLDWRLFLTTRLIHYNFASSIVHPVRTCYSIDLVFEYEMGFVHVTIYLT